MTRILNKSKSLKYSDALKNPDIPYVSLIEQYDKPQNVYKYQSFYNDDGNANKYWQTNMTGKTFRLNVASSFEDINDCRPFFDRNKVIDYMKSFAERFCKSMEADMLTIADEEITKEHFDHIVSNYQNNIQIGCFTASANNDHMWKKYGNQHKGYCIEYDVSKNELLSHNMLPVIYEERAFDSSFTFFLALMLEGIKQGKKRSFEENSEFYGDCYKKLLKLVYLPAFIKGMRWADEEEYRLFLIPHFQSAIRMVKADEELDSSKCINLEEAVTAIHLGKFFHHNPESKKLLDEIRETLKGREISLFQRQIDGKEVKIM